MGVEGLGKRICCGWFAWSVRTRKRVRRVGLERLGKVKEKGVWRVELAWTGECRKECVLDVPRPAWLAGEDTRKSV